MAAGVLAVSADGAGLQALSMAPKSRAGKRRGNGFFIIALSLQIKRRQRWLRLAARFVISLARRMARICRTNASNAAPYFCCSNLLTQASLPAKNFVGQPKKALVGMFSSLQRCSDSGRSCRSSLRRNRSSWSSLAWSAVVTLAPVAPVPSWLQTPFRLVQPGAAHRSANTHPRASRNG